MDDNLKGKLIIINVSEIIHVVLRKVWLILAVGVIFAAVGGAYAGMVAKSNVPMYRTTTKLYMASTSSYGSGQATIPNYIQMVESRPVLEGVITNLGLNMTYNELLGCISDTTPTGTNMLWLSVAFPDPEWAKRVADELVKVSAAYALEIMGCVPPIVYEEAGVPVRAYNTVYASTMKYAVLGFAGGVILAGCFVLAMYFLKDRFDTPSKVEDRLRTKLRAFTVRNKNNGLTNEQAFKGFMNSLYSDEINTKVLPFVSDSDKEGRDELVAELAETLSEYERNVLLLDFVKDISDEQVANGKQNLRTYLAGNCYLDDIICSEENIDVVYGGDNSGIVCEVYAGTQFDTVLSELSEKYDHVLVNVPAMENHMEAAVIVKKVGSAILVLSAKTSSVFKSKKLLKKLEAQSVDVQGAILLDVKIQGKAYYRRTYKMFMEG